MSIAWWHRFSAPTVLGRYGASPCLTPDYMSGPELKAACLGIRLVERLFCPGEEGARRHRPVRAWERGAVGAVVGEDLQFPPALVAGPQQRGRDSRCDASPPAREFPVERGAFRIADVAGLDAVDPLAVAEQVLVQVRLAPRRAGTRPAAGCRRKSARAWRAGPAARRAGRSARAARSAGRARRTSR
jgi:hypothetical protein